MGAIEILKYYLTIEREQWLDRDAIDRISEKRLGAALCKASSCRYYRDLFDTCGQELAELPITEKDSIRNDLDAFLPDDARKETLQEIRTSGSTGTPLSIYVDKDAQEYRTAKEYFVECLSGRSPFEMFAQFSSIPDQPHPFLTHTGLFRRMTLSPFVPDEENLSAIRRHRVRMIRAFPSGMTTMAKLNSENPVRLKSVLSTGEMLDNGNRRLIEDSFSCDVLESYGMMEFRTVAFQCPEEKRFHVDETSFLVEIADANGKPKRSGRGEIVVTSLHSTPMPFIRYATGDTGSWGKECPCGRSTRVIRSIEGRKTDVFTLPSGRLRPFGVLYSVLNRVMVRAFQVIQEQPDLFVFRYVPLGNELADADKGDIERKILAACLDEKITVEFEQVDAIPRIGRGKQPYVISKVRNYQ